MAQFSRAPGRRSTSVATESSLAGLGDGPLLEALFDTLGREMTIRRRTTVTAVRKDDAGAALTLEHEGTRSELRVARVLVAVGRRAGARQPSASRRAGVQLEHGVPVHDEYLAHEQRRDIRGRRRRRVRRRCSTPGRSRGAPPVTTPRDPTTSKSLRSIRAWRIVFSDPAVADRRPRSPDCRPGGPSCARRTPAVERSGRARVIDQTDAVAQLVVDASTRKVLGCQIVGPSADLLIHMVGYAIQLGATVDTLVELHHYHPTLAEMIPSLAQLIIRDLDGRDCDRGDIAPCPECSKVHVRQRTTARRGHRDAGRGLREHGAARRRPRPLRRRRRLPGSAERVRARDAPSQRALASAVRAKRAAVDGDQAELRAVAEGHSKLSIELQ